MAYTDDPVQEILQKQARQRQRNEAIYNIETRLHDALESQSDPALFATKAAECLRDIPDLIAALKAVSDARDDAKRRLTAWEDLVMPYQAVGGLRMCVCILCHKINPDREKIVHGPDCPYAPLEM